MNRTRIIKALYGSLIGIVLVLMEVPLAAANPPSWDTQNIGPGRFKVLSQFAGAAVLDKETGLVWDRSPDATERTWFNALIHCYQRDVGGRKGWRLPTIEELASLVDTSNSSPALPTGHPFTLTSAQVDGSYWSATTDASTASFAWFVDLTVGVVSNDGAIKTTTPALVWCVRGGQGIDGVQ